jgi:hypothetical protein
VGASGRLEAEDRDGAGSAPFAAPAKGDSRGLWRSSAEQEGRASAPAAQSCARHPPAPAEAAAGDAGAAAAGLEPDGLPAAGDAAAPAPSPPLPTDAGWMARERRRIFDGDGGERAAVEGQVRPHSLVNCIHSLTICTR